MIEVRKTGFDQRRKTLFVFFTGGYKAEQQKGFNFENLARTIGYPAVLVRDLSGNFYDTDNYAEALADLAEICAEFRRLRWMCEDSREECFADTGRIVFVGTSMGGYGAFKFGAQIRPDKIIAFAPQVAWPGHPDISPLYQGLAIPIDIHICRTSNYQTDAAHASLMNRVAGATIFVHDCGVHNVAGVLRDREGLSDIVLRDA